MALDRCLHGNQRPRTEVERIVELYRAGRLAIGEAMGMLWMKGMDATAAHALLIGTPAPPRSFTAMGEKG